MSMGTMKNGVYIASVEQEQGSISFRLKDLAGRIVAEGSGATVSEAQEQALGNAKHEDAREHLLQVKYPETLVD
jgi:hypothetical protein